MAPGGYSLQTSEQLAFGDTTTDNTSSGQHGLLVNFADRGASLTPTNTDSSGNSAQLWLILGVLGAGVVVWLILRRKGH